MVGGILGLTARPLLESLVHLASSLRQDALSILRAGSAAAGSQKMDRLSREAALISSLMAQRGPSLVAELLSFRPAPAGSLHWPPEPRTLDPC
jgi:hypothetical protein